VFGFGFFPGVLALVIWSIATSIAEYRAVATRDQLANEAGTLRLVHFLWPGHRSAAARTDAVSFRAFAFWLSLEL
jgi:hypothetical protein